MATIERDFGLKADEQGFLLGVKKLGQDVASIDTNVQRIIDILSHAPVQDFKQVIHQSKLTRDTAKIAASSAALLQNNKQLVTLLSSRSQGKAERNQQPPITPPTQDIAPPSSSQGQAQPPLSPSSGNPTPPTQQPPSPSDTPPVPQQPPSGNPPTDSPTPPNERLRDENGRFVGSGDAEKKGFFSKIAQAIKSGLSSDSSSIDPTIDAMREVGQVLEPVGKVAQFTLRPFGFRNKEKNKPLSREEERHNRRQIRLLERIARMASRGGSSGGNSSFAGGLLGGLLKGAGGLLLRAVMSPVTLLAGAFFGGYKLGELIAPKISEWTDSLIKADIPTRISNAWDAFTSGLSGYIKEKINNIKENTKELVNDAKDTVGSVGDFAAAKTDEFLAKFGVTKQIRKDAQDRVDQRDRGEIGFTPTSYQAKTTNKHSLGQVAADTGEALTTQPLAKQPSDIEKIIVNNKDGSNTVQLADGSIVKRTGNRNWRNHNPGNLEYGDIAKKHGAMGSDGRFAIFPSYEAGRAAKEELIFDSNRGRQLSTKGDYGANLGYKDKNLTQMIAAYAPSEDNNDVPLYQRMVLNSVGGKNKRMSEYTAQERGLILDAMEKMEGYKKGKEQVLQAATQQPSQAQKQPIATINKTNTPIANGLTTTPLAMLPKAQAPAFSLMRPTQQVEVKPSVISQTQHKIAVSQIPKPESVKEPIGTPSPMMVRNVDNGQQITQNLSDRHLAHLVTGGLGMTDRWTR